MKNFFVALELLVCQDIFYRRSILTEAVLWLKVKEIRLINLNCICVHKLTVLNVHWLPKPQNTSVKTWRIVYYWKSHSHSLILKFFDDWSCILSFSSTEEENAQAITNEKELEPTNQPKSESVDEKDKQG